jgi:hypothetical protein
LQLPLWLQNEAVEINRQMHRIGADPVHVSVWFLMRVREDGANRPVRSAFYAKRCANPAGCAGMPMDQYMAARNERLDRRIAPVLLRNVRRKRITDKKR